MIRRLVVSGLAAGRGGRLLFADLSFALEAGRALSVVGPNGVGKTTLLRLVCGLGAPAAGTIRFETDAGPLEVDEARSLHTHLLGHRDGLRSSRSAGEELHFWCAWAGGERDAARAAAERLGLSSLLDIPVSGLSAGQRRRLALARLLAAPRALWVLDEPFAPLDQSFRGRLAEVLSEHLAGGGLVLAATHDPLPVASGRLELVPA